MRVHHATLLLVAAAALAACNGKKPEPQAGPSAASGSTVATTEHDHGACERATSEGNTCDLKGNKLTCHLFVGMTKNNKPYVTPYKLTIKGGVIGGETVIAWHLVDDDLKFETGHGPHNWSKSQAISENELTDDADGERKATPPGQARRYRIKLDTSVPAPAADPHKYKVKFKQGANKVHICDPIIINADSN